MTQSLETVVHPGPIMGLVSGFWQTKMLLVAVEHGIFTELSRGPATAAELAGRLGLVESGTYDLLVGLGHLGLLENGEGTFANAPVAEQFLVRDRPEYLGGYLRFVQTDMNPAWEGLATSLVTGEPHNPAAVAGNPYDTLYRDPGATDAFLECMDLLNTPVGVAMSGFDWSPYTSFVDIGGARGNFAHQVVSRHPHLRGVVFDLPPLEPAFTRHIDRLGGDAADKVTFTGGDFFVDALPTADVLVFGHVLHNWGDEARIRLLKSAYEALEPGGAVFVYDHMTEGGQRGLNSVLAGLTMLVWSRGGNEYSVEQLHGWLAEAGLRPETVEVPGLTDDVLVIGHKDR